MTPTPAGDAAIFVVKGTDPGLVDRGVEQLLAELTSSRGDKDRTGRPVRRVPLTTTWR